MSLEGTIFLISLLEIHTDDTEILADRIRWPEVVGSKALPRIDGVLALYDVTNRESIKHVPLLLSEWVTFINSLFLHRSEGSPSLLQLPYPPMFHTRLDRCWLLTR